MEWVKFIIKFARHWSCYNLGMLSYHSLLQVGQ